jgi:DMSO/TMAO reductase YedYZ molybdopterin-dependent catalytic subunit
LARRRGLAAGLIGALAMQVWWFLVPPGLGQAMEDRILGRVPGALFGFLLDRLEFTGKPLLYVVLLLLQLAAGAALGVLLARVASRGSGHRAAAGAGVGALGWLLSCVLFGGEASAPAVLAGFLIYGVAAALALTLFTEPDAAAGPAGATAPAAASAAAASPAAAAASPAAAPADPSRRRLIGNALAAGLAVLTAAGAADTIARIGERGTAPGTPRADRGAAVPAVPRTDRPAVGGRLVPTASQVTPPGGLTPAITANADFYVVSKNFVDPTVDAAGWTLEVSGPFTATPLRLSYDDLRAMPSVSQYVTLECISNDVGGPLISNAYWTGVPLRALLEKAGMKPGAGAVAFACADGYTESLPIDHALRPTTIIAHTMNGQPLPDKHGFPARVITTGLYGMKNPKWLRTIQPVARAPQGYWETEGWAAEAPVATMSRIDVPAAGSAVSGTVVLGGIAFAGDRGIRKVEVSVDGGASWLPARLEKPLSPDTWVLWYLPLRETAPGTVTALVRATDGTGEVQTPEVADSFPAGATGYASRQFRISG